MKRAVVLILALLTAAMGSAQQPLQSQPQPQTELPEPTPFYFLEAINLASTEPGEARLDILYRIDLQFFVPVRNTNPTIPSPFVRRGEILVELFDENDVSKAREIRHFEVGETNPNGDMEVKNWREGAASFSIPPGEYTVVFEIDDLESTRKHLDKKRKIEARIFKGEGVATSTPLFVFPPQQPDVIAPINFGGNVLFGKGAALFVQITSPALTSDSVRVEYTIATQRFFLQEPRFVTSDTLRVVPLSASSPVRQADTPTSYKLEPLPEGQPTRALLLPLKAERLPLRPFTLSMKIVQGTLTVPIELKFKMVWPDMPLSLRDVDFALEALRHITRPEELDSLKSGTRDSRLAHLEEFWRAKDKTPETEYNEVMVEYYRRVDYTMRAFSSLRSGDGYKTDRGRIYILYGPPTRVDRVLDPQAGYQEIWTYEKQNKRFVFLDQSRTGNYVLIATQTH
ncbi:MAG: hypothetical protein C4326_12250 [Ignavibacteria bacterium]